VVADGFELTPAFLEGIQEQQRNVRAVMSDDVITVTEDTPAREVARLMYGKNTKRVPVVRDGKLVGIVAGSNLVLALAQKLNEMPAATTMQRDTADESLRRRREEDLRNTSGSPPWGQWT
jgi:predicted transcriptional regulator